ncbi:MAG: tetratricopeptide repeat protein [Deltaproteobacteria bacterium]|nr:tetratricopeptide repeat protein [Deltaproteobacteria bacterium]
MIAGVTSAVLAIINRVLGLDRIAGLVPTMRPASELLTTFVNPNHSAGFMVLTSLTAVGIALAHQGRRRWAWLGVGAAAGAVVVMTLSRGGIVALVAGLVLFGLLAWRSRARQEEPRALKPIPVIAAVVLPLVALVVSLPRVSREFVGREGEVLGLEEKLSATRDALPMIGEHLWWGIGRGSYVSVYPIYKKSPLQLTFAFPENIGVQLLAEWGVVIGTSALLGLALAVGLRVGRAVKLPLIGALSGVAAVLLHNLVDFSLEIPGMAVPVAAVLGAASTRLVRSVRVSLEQARVAIAFATVPTAILIGLVAAALAAPDVWEDMSDLSAVIDARGPVEATVIERWEPVVAAHPANATLAARLAHLSERVRPPDLTRGVRWANRALYLAPTYADGYLVAGRLLIGAGHRAQGFELLRQAWALSALDRRRHFLQQVIRLARSVDEIRGAVPRRNSELDIPDEAFVAQATHALLHSRGPKKDWAAELIAQVDVPSIPHDRLRLFAVAGLSAGQYEVAERCLAGLVGDESTDPDTVVLHARLSLRRGDRAAAKQVLAGSLSRKPAPLNVVRMALELAIQDADVEDAEALMAQLGSVLAPSAASRAELAGYEADLARALQRPARALAALDRAIELIPQDARLRTKRAEVLSALGRVAEARHDLEFVLARDPDDARARSLLARLHPANP